ncbi:hypothetical protein, partial [Acetobacter nitrogenifigens]|uniref:hypothetical protein n=1 Tax=Acetobacter nitrogenifigens TaxID=285268 RepID=UPI001C3FC213
KNRWVNRGSVSGPAMLRYTSTVTHFAGRKDASTGLQTARLLRAPDHSQRPLAGCWSSNGGRKWRP